MVRAADRCSERAGLAWAGSQPRHAPAACLKWSRSSWEPPGRDEPHEDTAQCSPYEVIAGWSISAGDDSASVSPAHGSLSSAGRVAGSPSCTPGRLEQPTITRHVRYART